MTDPVFKKNHLSHQDIKYDRHLASSSLPASPIREVEQQNYQKVNHHQILQDGSIHPNRLALGTHPADSHGLGIHQPTEATDALKVYMRHVSKNSLLTAEEEMTLAQRVVSGCAESRDKMIRSNLRLVVRWARNYRFHGISFIDLVEEGNLGLIRAVDKFNPDLGYRFSTYASWWIRQAIDRAVMNQERMVRLPFHVVRELKTCQKSRVKLSQINGQEPSYQEIATHVGKTEAKVKSLLFLCEKVVSLDNPLTSSADIESSFSLKDILPSPINQTPEFVATVGDLVEMLTLWVDRLDKLEKEVICSRFGLQGYQPITLEKLGARLGMTRERVRQIQIRTLNNLRKDFTACGLEHIDLVDYEL